MTVLGSHDKDGAKVYENLEQSSEYHSVCNIGDLE